MLEIDILIPAGDAQSDRCSGFAQTSTHTSKTEVATAHYAQYVAAASPGRALRR